MAQITSGSLTIVDVTDGAPGLNNTTVFLYRRAASAPNKPTGNLTYTFSTASITGALEGWVQSINELTGSNPIWMIAAVASSNGETDVIESSEWAGPIKMAQNGQDGQPGSQGASVATTRELYYLKTNSTDPAQITNANQIHTTDDVNQWTSVVPTYIGSGKYYTCIETTLSNGNVVWSAPAENKGLTDANINVANAIEIARGIKQHFFWVATDKSENIPAGAYIAEESEESFYSSPTKGNILTRSDGIWIRNGVDKLATLQGSGLTFLVPTGTYKGQKSVSLNGSGLTFYNIGSSNSAAAMLASDGLQIENGSIILGGHGTSGVNAGDVALSNKNFTRSINGTSHNDLRFAIGSKFGVASDGTLYATGGVFNNYSTTTEMNTAIGNAVDGIDVGGRNRYSYSSTSLWGYKFSVTKDASINGITATRTVTDDVGGVVRLQHVIDDVNSEWTVSFDVKGTGSGGVCADICDTQIDITKYPIINISSDYQHYVGCVKPAQVTSVYDFVDINADATVTALTIKNIKVEKGNKATDWTPAPEDVQAEIDAKKSTHTVTGTGGDASTTYAIILGYNERNLKFSVDSSVGIKAGDTVRVKILVSNMNNTPVYVVGTATEIPSSTQVIMTVHGIDTTVIDGGHILTGQIDANRMNANVINAVNNGTGKINADKINASQINIGDLAGEIGGRNLIKCSRNLADFMQESANCPTTVYPDYLSIKHTYNNASTYGAYYDIPSPEVGAKYTLSFDSTAVSGGLYSVGGAGTSSVWAGIVNYKTVVTGRNKVTFTVPSGATSLRIYFSVNVYNSDLHISNVKLEKGEVATEWTPDPDDTPVRQKINVKDILLENAQHTSITVSGESITFKRISDSTGSWGAYYDFPCEPNSYYTVSAKVEGGDAGEQNKWNIIFGTATSIESSVSIWMGLGRTCNYAGIGGYYISTNNTKTYAAQKYIRVYFYSSTPNATWTLSDITIQKGTELARSTDYITHIDNNGIRVHPSSTLQNSVVINASGMEVFKGGTAAANSVAFYGDTARIGKTNANRFLMNASSLQAYDSSGTKYFEVSASGLTYGTNTVATTTQVSTAQTTANNAATAASNAATAASNAATAASNAAKTATTYITDIDSNLGITVKPATKTGNDYLQMNSTDIRFVRNNVDVMNLTDSAFRIGTASGKHATVDTNGLHVWTGAESTATNEVAFFGATARIGTTNKQRIEVTSAVVSLYDSNNKERTQVNTSGLLIKNASGNTKASVYDTITLYGGGGTYPLTQITSSNVQIAQSANNYANVNSSGLQVYQGGNEIASFGSTARIGKTASKHLSLDATNGLQIFTGTESDSTNIAQFSDTGIIYYSTTTVNSNGVPSTANPKYRRSTLFNAGEVAFRIKQETNSSGQAVSDSPKTIGKISSEQGSLIISSDSNSTFTGIAAVVLTADTRTINGVHSEGPHIVVGVNSGNTGYITLDAPVIDASNHKIQFDSYLYMGYGTSYTSKHGSVAIGHSDGGGNIDSGLFFRQSGNNNVTGIYVVNTSFAVGTNGSKSKLFESDKETRAMYCYEMPSPMFGDIGCGETDNMGLCYVDIDKIFANASNVNIVYQVFLQKEGEGDLWVEEKNSTYFIVKGTANLKFSWELKAKQTNFETERMEVAQCDRSSTDFLNDEPNYLDNNIFMDFINDQF